MINFEITEPLRTKQSQCPVDVPKIMRYTVPQLSSVTVPNDHNVFSSHSLNSPFFVNILKFSYPIMTQPRHPLQICLIVCRDLARWVSARVEASRKDVNFNVHCGNFFFVVFDRVILAGVVELENVGATLCLLIQTHVIVLRFVEFKLQVDKNLRKSTGD